MVSLRVTEEARLILLSWSRLACAAVLVVLALELVACAPPSWACPDRARAAQARSARDQGAPAGAASASAAAAEHGMGVKAGAGDGRMNVGAEERTSEDGSTGVEAERVILRSAEVVRSLARVAQASRGDCAAMAAGLHAWADAHASELRDLYGAAMQIPEERRAERMQELLAGDTGVQQGLDALAACSGHPDVARAMERMQSAAP